MNKFILTLAMVMSSASVFAGDFTKSEYGCYKVKEIRFDGQSAEISGDNVVEGKNGIGMIISFGEGYNDDEYQQNVELAKFAMANDLQLCRINGSRLLSVKK